MIPLGGSGSGLQYGPRKSSNRKNATTTISPHNESKNIILGRIARLESCYNTFGKPDKLLYG